MKLLYPVCRLLVLCVLLVAFVSKNSYSQTSLSFAQIPISDPDLNAPGRGAEQWHSSNDVDLGYTPQDVYYRFVWSRIEGATQGSYNWDYFDNLVNTAINKKQKLSFGIMTVYPEGSSANGLVYYDGAYSCYPQYLHSLMQAEGVRDYRKNSSWIPNYNSVNYHNRLLALHQALNAHIGATSYNGVPYKNVIQYIDIRGFGSWGEWHHVGLADYYELNSAGVFPNISSFKKIVDAHITGFPDYRLVCMIAAFDAGQLASINNPAEIAHYILTHRGNNAGPIGWRRDQWGALDDYLKSYLEFNTRSFNGVVFNTLIMDRWKTAPVTGEPPSWIPDDYSDLERQIRLYRAASFGNGNYGTSYPNGTISDRVRAASKACGYRLIAEGGSMSTSITTGTAFSITLNWRNVGLSPTYENWDVVYELKNSSGTTVWSGTSGMQLKLFLPQVTATPRTDNFTVPTSVPAGTYSLIMYIRDPNNFRQPLPLAITGRRSDGGYVLRSSVTVTTGSGQSNTAPVANAGSDQTISLPTALASLTGSGTDADGTIASYQWQQVSGPSTSILSALNLANITVSSLQAGTYTYRLTVTDNEGATDTDDVTVTVNPLLNQAPTANAGTDRTITLPTNSTSLSGSGSTDTDGTVATYAWQQTSGPSASTLSATNTANITVSNLQAGTYTYRLSVTDNDGATDTDDVTVTVNPAANQAPAANAGTDRTITLPTNSSPLSGSGSTDADGTIASYAWQQVSGPSTSTLSATNSANITVSNLQAGTYTYRLTVTDNAGATDVDDVIVTVNAAPPNQAPVANAGTNRSITLPTNSASLAGSGTDADGTIASYSWQQISGPSASTLSATNTANITVSNLAAGVYTYRLTVRDNDGATATDDVTVTVNAAINQAPVANAGSNRTITLPTSSSSLAGSGTDADGTISAYLWTQVNGPSTATLSTTNTANITVSTLVAGTYTFRLRVTDNDGATDTDDVTVTVNAAVNQAPAANAGANKAITLPTSSTTLDGNGSTDADGTIASYAWLQLSGPSASTLSATNTAGITISNLQAGTYTYRLTVTDNDGATDTDDVTVTVNAAPVNQAPNADAGINRNITLPTNSTTLSGSGSTDPDGTIASYAWQQVSGPSASTLSATNIVGITVSNLQAGTYVYRLTVTDNDGATDTDDVSVIVNAAPVNQAPTANAGANRAITLPTSSTTLSGSGTDADGTITSYQWQQVSGPSSSTLSAANTAGITVSNLQAGTYVYRLTVIDNDGATDTDDVTVTVNAATVNKAPNADAGNNRSITLPTNSTTLSGSGSTDADGTIASYQWQQVSGPSASTFSATNTVGITVSNLAAGTYTYRLTVTDNDGATDTDDVTVTVRQRVNQSPNANAGSKKAVTLPNNSTLLSGAASTDTDGTIASYQWQQVSGPSTSTLSATTTEDINVSNLEAGVYIYRLTVTDNDGASSTDDVTVTVNALPNEAPIANAGTNLVITLPTGSANLSGSGIDTDGTIAGYQWQQISGPSASTLSAINTANITVSNLQVGMYIYRLTVRDNDNATGTDNVTVTVNAAPPNQAPVANAGANRVLTLPTNSTSLNGSASSDADGRIASYLWQQVSGPSASTLSATNTANITVSNLQAGVYSYRLTVRDDDNATATATVTVTVNVPPNTAPIAEAGVNQTVVITSNSTTLDAEGSRDPDGTITSYTWQQLRGPGATTFSATTGKTVDISNLAVGDYVYRLTVRDNRNATATDTVKVTVIDNFRNFTDPVAIYPNPATDVINIRLLSDKPGRCQVNVYDLNGKRVLPTLSVNKPAGAYSVPVTVTGLTPGTYVVQVSTFGYKKLAATFIKL